MYVPGIPTHVVQRGHNRAATFFCDADYLQYKAVLQEGLLRYGVALHAYCLMGNHVHLLLTPDAPDAISRLMQHIGRRYVGYINGVRGRTGALWEGRHKNSLVAHGAYLLAAYRYIEINPVAAGIVHGPADYPWSSFGFNGLGNPDDLLTPHAEYLGLGSDVLRARIAYRGFVAQKAPADDVAAIHAALNANYPIGDASFVEQIEQALGRSIGQLGPGGRREGVVRKQAPRPLQEKAGTTTPSGRHPGCTAWRAGRVLDG
jgi:putative transposase